MTEIVDPVLQVKALQELARTLPPGRRMQTHLFWENDHGTAGATLETDGRCSVYLFDALQDVETLAEAAELLRAIFADEVAAVRAYANEVFVYGGLAPTDDPSAGFNGLASSTSRSKTMPDIDYVAIATWSRGYLDDGE